MHGGKEANLLLYYVPTASNYYTTATATTIMPITYVRQQQQPAQEQNDIYNNSSSSSNSNSSSTSTSTSSNPSNYFTLSMWDLTSTTLRTTLTALSESLHRKNSIINSNNLDFDFDFDVYERTTAMEGNTNIFDSLQTLAPTIGGHFKKLLNATNNSSNNGTNMSPSSYYNNLGASTSSRWNQSGSMFLNVTSAIVSNISDYNSSGNHLHNHGVGDANEIAYVPYVMRPETYIVPVLFALIFIVGVLGNGTLVVVFLSVRQMRNVPNTYILSLALADLLVIVTTVPLTSTVYTVDTWPWGSFLCTLSEFIKDVSIGVSVFTLIALSADRYFAIVDPLRKFHAHGGGKRATHMTIAIAVSIWILAMFCGLPSLLGTYIKDIKINSKVSFSTCYPFPEKWGKPYAKTIVLLRFLVYYAIPLIIIGVFYVLIACHLMYSANVPGEMQGAIRQVRARRKVAVTVLSFVVIFGICFLPSHVFMLWFYYWPTAEEDYNSFWHVLRIVGFCLSFANSCANPVALYFVSGAFRKHFNRYLFCQDGGSRHIKRHCQRSDTHSMHREMSLTSTNASTKRCYHRRSYHNHSTIRSRLAETTITVMPNDGTYHSDYQSEVTAVALDETLSRQGELKQQRFKCQQQDEAFM